MVDVTKLEYEPTDERTGICMCMKQRLKEENDNKCIKCKGKGLSITHQNHFHLLNRISPPINFQKTPLPPVAQQLRTKNLVRLFLCPLSL